jgi:ABC-type lipoprotein export system ATPase subunit
MISVSNLAFRYSSITSIAFPDFSIGKGQHLLLLGESGSGKTTLLHLIGGLLRNYDGKIIVDDMELSMLTESAMDKFRGRHIGFIFQRNHLINALSVEKNLLLSPYLAGLLGDKRKVSEILLSLGLTEKRSHKVTELSQGQAQRISIARALMNNPSILLADEPTSALDDKNCDRVIRLLMDAASANQTTLMVATHDHRLKGVIKNEIILA